VADSASFLYLVGSPPRQPGVDVSQMDLNRLAVVRGQVMTKATAANGNEVPLPGVTVTVVGHGEFGSTKTGSDGWFDMAVNGGAALTFNYASPSTASPAYISVQRTAQTRWHDYTVLKTVKMMQPESSAAVTLSSTNGYQFIRGLQHGVGAAGDDSDGPRT